MRPRSQMSQTLGLPQNQGYVLFKTALEESPDVIALIKSIAKTEPKEQIAQRKAKIIQKSIRDSQRKHRPASGHKYGVYERFGSRPTSAPGPGQYIQRRLSGGCGFKMQSRYESIAETTPGPQSYLVSDVKDSTLGIMTREAKYKDNAEFYQTFLGPGSYEIDSTLSDVGWKFAKEGRETELDVLPTQPATGLRQRPEQRPGPGHYNTKSEFCCNAFSMAKSPKGHKKTSSMLGPGTYTVALPKDSVEFKFSSVPRFFESFKERMESTLYSEYQPRYRRKSIEERESEKLRFEANKDLSKYTPAQRRKSLEDQRTQRDLQIAIANQTKETIFQAEKMRRRIAYEEKMQKYQFRMRKDELAEMQTAWFIAAMFASMLCDVHRGYAQLKVNVIAGITCEECTPTEAISDAVHDTWEALCPASKHPQTQIENCTIHTDFTDDYSFYRAMDAQKTPKALQPNIPRAARSRSGKNNLPNNAWMDVQSHFTAEARPSLYPIPSRSLPSGQRHMGLRRKVPPPRTHP